MLQFHPSAAKMNHKTLPNQGVGSARGKLNNEKSSSFMMENILKPDKYTREQKCPSEAPSKIKALSVAAQLAGLYFLISPKYVFAYLYLNHFSILICF